MRTIDRKPRRRRDHSEEDDSEYSIKASVKQVGYIYPTLVDSSDRIIDGRIRLKIDPDWPCFRLSHIDNLPKFLMARIISNVFRRQVTDEEVAELVGELAQETGWTPQEIADKLGQSPEWVLRHIPDEYKQSAKWRGVRSETAALENRSHMLEAQKPFLTCPTPTKKALEALKRALELEKGCLQYKRKGDMVYVVIYDAETEKRVWHRVGCWRYLRKLLDKTRR